VKPPRQEEKRRLPAPPSGAGKPQKKEVNMKLMEIIPLILNTLGLDVDIIATPNGAMLTDEKGSPVGVMRLANGRRLEMVYRNNGRIEKKSIRLPKFVCRPMYAGDKLRAAEYVATDEVAIA
jgi:hypothetical protein